MFFSSQHDVTRNAKTAHHTGDHFTHSGRGLAATVQIPVRPPTGRYYYRTRKFYLLFPADDRAIDFNCFVGIVVVLDAQMSRTSSSEPLKIPQIVGCAEQSEAHRSQFDAP